MTSLAAGIKVVHFRIPCHDSVTNSLVLSGICPPEEILLNNFNGFHKCLKYRQTSERCQKQGKNGGPENFSAELSPQTVDRFSLVPGSGSVQQDGRIGVCKKGLDG